MPLTLKLFLHAVTNIEGGDGLKHVSLTKCHIVSIQKGPLKERRERRKGRKRNF